MQSEFQYVHPPRSWKPMSAPFSLSFGALMTAQFVIEDQAVRAVWHHLARIHMALRRQIEVREARESHPLAP
jgi:hypothetical protein